MNRCRKSSFVLRAGTVVSSDLRAVGLAATLTMALAIGLAAALAAGLTTGLAARAAAGEQVTVDGQLHVRNTAQPSAAQEIWRLKEQWRVGGEEGEVLFGVVSKVLPDEDGSLYVLDLQLSHIEVFSATGEHLRTLSREGEGPGETRRPIDLVWTPDGNLGMVQTFPGKLVKIDRGGQPLASLSFGAADPSQGNLVALTEVAARDDGYIIAGTNIVMGASGQARKTFLASYTPEGQEQVRYYEREIKFDAANLQIVEKDQYVVARRNWALGPDGRIYTAPYREEYKVHVYHADGTLDRVIEREFKVPARTAEELRRIEEAMQAAVARSPVPVKTEVAPTNQAISAMWVDAAGQLWVQHAASHLNQPAGIMLTYDVFDPQGNFTRQVSIAGGGDGERDLLRIFDDGRAVLICGLQDAALAMQGGTAAGEDAQALAVVVYEVER